MDSKALSARLKTLREQHKFTQKELGNYLNISQQGYCHYENGNRTPDLYILKNLANLYGITMEELLNFHTTKSPASCKVAETPPDFISMESLSYQEKTLLKLFSELSPDEKADFMTLLTIKYQLYKSKKYPPAD